MDYAGNQRPTEDAHFHRFLLKIAVKKKRLIFQMPL
jgi:hypothetical protein